MEIVKKLQKEINGFELRKFEIDNFCVVEYSKAPTFFRYVSVNNMDENYINENLLYEVRAERIDLAENLMLQKINLINTCKNDFNNIGLLEYNPIFSQINEDLAKVLYLKTFTAFEIWDIEKNTKSIAIITLNIKDEIKIILDWLELFKHHDSSTSIHLIGEDFDTKKQIFTNNIYLFVTNCNMSRDEIRAKFMKQNIFVKIRDDQFREELKPDYFICHDSRDKDNVARPLAEILTRKGKKVWYDEYSLQIGDSLAKTIMKGIKECRRGIVIISPNSISNEKWIEFELSSLLNKEIYSSGNVILPVWHNVTLEDLKDYNYYLLDKLAGNTNDGLEILADKIIKVK